MFCGKLDTFEFKFEFKLEFEFVFELAFELFSCNFSLKFFISLFSDRLNAGANWAYRGICIVWYSAYSGCVLYCSGILVNRVWRYLYNSIAQQSKAEQRRNEIGGCQD